LFSRRLSPAHWEAHGLQPELVGVAVFSTPQHPNVVTNVFPGNPNDSTELGRFVLLDNVGSNAETFFLSRCLQQLKRIGLRGVVAHSDDQPRPSTDGTIAPGHLGIIYQSCSSTSSSAIFLGRASRKTLYYFRDGYAIQGRTLSKLRNQECGFQYASELFTQRGASPPGPDVRAWLDHWLPRLTTRVRHPGVLKYAWPLQPKIIPVGQPYPYPKRFPSAEAMALSKDADGAICNRVFFTDENSDRADLVMDGYSRILNVPGAATD